MPVQVQLYFPQFGHPAYGIVRGIVKDSTDFYQGLSSVTFLDSDGKVHVRRTHHLSSSILNRSLLMSPSKHGIVRAIVKDSTDFYQDLSSFIFLDSGGKKCDAAAPCARLASFSYIYTHVFQPDGKVYRSMAAASCTKLGVISVLIKLSVPQLQHAQHIQRTSWPRPAIETSFRTPDHPGDMHVT